jgi:hypothetical protein
MCHSKLFCPECQIDIRLLNFKFRRVLNVVLLNCFIVLLNCIFVLLNFCVVVLLYFIVELL